MRCVARLCSVRLLQLEAGRVAVGHGLRVKLEAGRVTVGHDSVELWASMTSYHDMCCFNFFKRLSVAQEKDASFPSFLFFFRFFLLFSNSISLARD